MSEAKQPRSTAILAIGLAAWIGICFLAAAVGGVATTSSVTGWYSEINKPSWNPPGWIFGPAWSVLYLMMGVSAWLVWKNTSIENSKLALGWFLFHLLLNILWSIVFFGLRQPGWAVVEIVALWISIVISILLFYRYSKLAASLLVPYLLWVSFATIFELYDLVNEPGRIIRLQADCNSKFPRGGHKELY